MKPHLFVLSAVALLGCTAADTPTATMPTTGGTSPTSPTSPTATVGPNVVVILGEAQGWTSTSVQMDPSLATSRQAQLKTPGLERIAAEGMRFSNFYAPSPRCTPSRAAFFTGRSPAALRMTFVGIGNDDAATSGPLLTPTASTDLATTYPTIASVLKGAGYATAHFGKWHVGRTNPSAYGFDASDGPTSNTGMNNVPNPNPAESYGMTARAIAFMAEQVRAKKRFYVQVSHYPGKRPLM